jgi:acetylglutamate kinase
VTGLSVVVKFGGELLEQPALLDGVVAAMRAVSEQRSLVVVHGGGKEIDAALRAAGIEKRQVDGLRITDDATLEVVVGVLAGNVNTRVTAALCRAGVGAVGLTGADGSCGLADPAPPHRAVDGRLVDLGRVGIPCRSADVTLVRTLCAAGFVPVIASIGVTEAGQLLNVNADTFAGRLAERLKARRLVVAGTTPGVLDNRGETLGIVDGSDIERLIGSGTATAGMIAKLRACQDAVGHGVGDVVIVDGRDRRALEAAALEDAPSNATRIVAAGYVGRTS